MTALEIQGDTFAEAVGFPILGEVWLFLRLQDAVLSVDENDYYISNVAEIVDRVGYIATLFTGSERPDNTA